MDTVIWPAEQKIQYSSLLLHHNMSNDSERRTRQIVEQQIKETFKHIIRDSKKGSRDI